MKRSNLAIALIILFCLSEEVIGYPNDLVVHEATKDDSDRQGQSHSPVTIDLVKKLQLWNKANARSPGNLSTLDENYIVIAIGGHSLEHLLKSKIPNPIIATFVSRKTFLSIVDRYRTPDQKQLPVNVTAIFSDPDPLKQLLLFTELYGSKQSIGIVRTQESHKLVEKYKSLAKSIGVEVNDIDINELNNAKEIVRRFKQDRSILLLRDKALFNRIGVEEILLKSYDLGRKGIIVYSGNLVRRGGLATTYSSFNDILNSIKEYTLFYRKHGTLPTPGYTRSFSLAINKYLARSLNIPIDDNKVIKANISKKITQNNTQDVEDTIEEIQGRNND